MINDKEMSFNLLSKCFDIKKKTSSVCKHHTMQSNAEQCVTQVIQTPQIPTKIHCPSILLHHSNVTNQFLFSMRRTRKDQDINVQYRRKHMKNTQRREEENIKFKFTKRGQRQAAKDKMDIVSYIQRSLHLKGC